MAKKARERLISSHLSRCNLNELPQHSTGVEGRGGAGLAGASDIAELAESQLGVLCTTSVVCDA